MNVKHFELRKDRAPYDGDVCDTTDDPKVAASWRDGLVTAIGPDGTGHGVALCHSEVAGRCAINILDAEGDTLATLDPWR